MALRYIVCLAFAVLTAACGGGGGGNGGSSGAEPAPTASQPKRIIFFGDSLTSGYRLSPDKAYPALLQKQLELENIPIVSVNAGVVGDTTEDGLARLDASLAEPVDIFVTALGANDAEDELPASQVESNLQQIIDRVKAVYPAAKFIVAGVELEQFLSGGGKQQYRDMYARLAARNSAVLIPDFMDGINGNPQLTLSDGIHPNAAGHQAIAAVMLSALRQLL